MQNTTFDIIYFLLSCLTHTISKHNSDMMRVCFSHDFVNIFHFRELHELKPTLYKVSMREAHLILTLSLDNLFFFFFDSSSLISNSILQTFAKKQIKKLARVACLTNSLISYFNQVLVSHIH